ncbi:MAG: radical SAM protein [Candidatus Geothermarchaeales archaeon]
MGLPSGVRGGRYRCSPPLIRPSKLTTVENGGVGKDLSEGWNLNFAVGCVHACPFCYVDSIHKRFGPNRYGDLVLRKWGDYILIPENLEEAVERTPWRRWHGKEAMMSSTHDPYLPQLAGWARRILEAALPAGVRICIQTRSFLVGKDLEFLAKYRDQVRLQVSIATMNRNLSRKIEPRVPSPKARLEILRRARGRGITTGVIVAPVLPQTRARADFEGDLQEIARELRRIQPDHIYGESLHIRGQNNRLLAATLGEQISIPREFDVVARQAFNEALSDVGLTGTWWPA